MSASANQEAVENNKQTVRPIIRIVSKVADYLLSALALTGAVLATSGQVRLMTSDEVENAVITAPFNPAKTNDSTMTDFAHDLHHQGHVQKENGLELLVIVAGLYIAKKKVDGSEPV